MPFADIAIGILIIFWSLGMPMLIYLDTDIRAVIKKMSSTDHLAMFGVYLIVPIIWSCVIFIK